MKSLLTKVVFVLAISAFYAQSTYEEPVNIPPYDPNNPDMMLIQSNADWSHINDANIHYFYVAPGDYSRAGLSDDDYRVLITQSGTPAQKRYIALYNGNNLHPGKLDRSQLAKVGFTLRNADYWVIDRMAYWERTDGLIAIVFEGASHNIINRYLADNVAGGMIYLFAYSNDNVIQNCRVQKDNLYLNLDRAAIALQGDNNMPVINNKIINNEVYNFVDGFQAVTDKGEHPDHFFDYQGTVVDNNVFYIDQAIYTDCNGHPDPNGDCAYAENAIDLKSGSENANNPFLVTNNVMWGYRWADGTNSDLDDVGSAIVVHYNVNNTVISGNVIFDADRAMTVGGRANGPAWRNSEFSNNIIYQTHDIAIKVYDSEDIVFEGNLLKEVCLDTVWKNTAFIDCNNITVRNDLRVDTYDTAGVRSDNSSVSASDNGYYNSLPGDIQSPSDTIYTSDPTAAYDDLTIETDRFTNHPFTITLPRVVNNAMRVDKAQQTTRLVSVYPNPARDMIYIIQNEPAPAQLWLTDLHGRILITQGLSLPKTGLNISKLTAGSYLIIVKTSDGRQQSIKLLKR